MKKWWNKEYAQKALYLFGALALTIIFGVILYNIASIYGFVASFLGAINSFIIGFAIAYILNPSYTFFREKVFGKLFKGKRRKLTKALSLVVLYILAIGIIGFLLYIVVPQFVKSIVDCVNNLIKNYDTYYNSVNDFVNYITGGNSALLGTVTDSIAEKLLGFLKGINTDDLLMLSSIAGSILSTVLSVIIGIIISVYMLYNKEKLCAQVKKAGYATFSNKTMHRLQKFFGTSHLAFGQYVTGVIIDAFIVGVSFGILCLIFRIPYAPLIAVVLGLTNMIPFFGPYIGGIPCAVIVLVNDPLKALLLIIMMIVVQQIDGNLVAPKIMSRKTGLDAIWVIFAILVGGYFFGVIGMLLAVPLFSVIYLFMRSFFNGRLERKNMSKDTADYYKDAEVDRKYLTESDNKNESK